MGVLVAYYSRAHENYFSGEVKEIEVGNTEKVAKVIAELTCGKLFKIEPKEAYANDYNTCIGQAKRALSENERPEMKDHLESLEDFDTVYLGYPNYWGTMPMVVYTFLESYDFSGKIIHPFCTHEGSGLSTTKNDIDVATKNSATIKKAIALLGTKVNSMTSEQIKDVILGNEDFIE